MRKVTWRALVLLGLAQFVAALTTCGDTNNMNVSGLRGKWVLESVNGQAAGSGSEVYFEIDGLTISGFDGCNRFGGRLDAPSQLRISQRACAEGGSLLPLELSDPEPQLKAAELVGDRLELPMPGGAGKATFRRQ